MQSTAHGLLKHRTVNSRCASPKKAVMPSEVETDYLDLEAGSPSSLPHCTPADLVPLIWKSVSTADVGVQVAWQKERARWEGHEGQKKMSVTLKIGTPICGFLSISLNRVVSIGPDTAAIARLHSNVRAVEIHMKWALISSSTPVLASARSSRLIEPMNACIANAFFHPVCGRHVGLGGWSIECWGVGAGTSKPCWSCKVNRIELQNPITFERKYFTA